MQRRKLLSFRVAPGNFTPQTRLEPYVKLSLHMAPDETVQKVGMPWDRPVVVAGSCSVSARATDLVRLRGEWV
jgi:hypothetical protein